MKKKVLAQNIVKGMYIAELDRPWIETSFLFQGFEVTTDEELNELRRQCTYVYIDTEQGIDTPADGGPRLAGGGPGEESESELSTRFHSATKARSEESAGRKLRYPDQTTLEEEIEVAKDIERQTRNVIFSIMDDVRLGRSIDSAGARKVVGDMADSIIRNPDAMVCLTQLKNKDEYTALHSLRVCVLALAFGRHLEMDTTELNLLGLGALLHDLGKMRIPGEILNKPGGLTEEEFAIMKSHVPLGVEILENTRGIPSPAIDVARMHHERVDGTGYSSGLARDAITTFGLIGGIVDCYDAITSDRAYHQGMSAHDALKKMYEWRRKDFDAGLVEHFIQCMGIYPIGSLVEMNTGSVGVVATINRLRRLKPRVVLVLDADKRRYTVPKVVNLMHTPLEEDAYPLEIKKVIASGTYGINPTDYLPV